MLDFVVKARNGRGPDDILREDFPLTQVLRNPNPMLTEYDFRYVTMLYILATGETYWRIVRPSRDTRTWQLWVLPKFWVQVNRNRETREVESYRLPYTKETVAKEDMIWLRSPDPLDPYMSGIGDLLSMATEIETFEAASETDLNFMKRDATPNGYLSVPGKITADEQQRLQDSWHRKYGGPGRQYSVPVLWGDMSFNLLRQNRKDMDFIEGQRWLRDVIIAGIPPEVLGIVENSNRATIEAADYTFSRYEILPRAKWLAASINKWLAPQFDSRIYLEFVRVIPDDVERLLRTALDPNIGGIQTVRQRQTLLHRAIGGVDVLEDAEVYGDNYILPAMSIPFTAEEGKPEPVAAPVPDTPAKPEDDDTPPPTGRAVDAKTPTLEDATLFLPKARPVATVTKLGLRDLSAILGELTETSAKLYVFLRPLYHAIMQQRWDQAANEVGLEIGFDVTDPNVAEYLLEQAGAGIRGITQTTQERLRETLAEGVTAGESIPDLARRVTEAFEDAKGSRAVMIARTETIEASNVSAELAYDRAGVEGKEWLTAGDESVRDSHAATEGQVVPIGATFTLGSGVPTKGPAQSGVAEEDINCRCAIAPVITSPEGEQRGLFQGEARKQHLTALGRVHDRQEKAFLAAVKRMWQAYQREVLVRLRAA